MKEGRREREGRSEAKKGKEGRNKTIKLEGLKKRKKGITS